MESKKTISNEAEENRLLRLYCAHSVSCFEAHSDVVEHCIWERLDVKQDCAWTELFLFSS